MNKLKYKHLTTNAVVYAERILTKRTIKMILNESQDSNEVVANEDDILVSYFNASTDTIIKQVLLKENVFISQYVPIKQLLMD